MLSPLFVSTACTLKRIRPEVSLTDPSITASTPNRRPDSAASSEEPLNRRTLE